MLLRKVEIRYFIEHQFAFQEHVILLPYHIMVYYSIKTEIFCLLNLYKK